jgi:hypothetical protein
MRESGFAFGLVGWDDMVGLCFCGVQDGDGDGDKSRTFEFIHRVARAASNTATGHRAKLYNRAKVQGLQSSTEYTCLHNCC